MIKLPISVCIIAKNEEKHIGNCLERIRPYGFEIIVVDTGSEDATREIAKRYTEQVYDFTWNDDFSAVRNFCAAKAAYDWILVLDCDEYVQDIDIRELSILMQKFPDYVGVLQLKNLLYGGGYGTDDVIRFYNRNYYTFDAPIHEQVCNKDVRKRGDKVNCFYIPAEVIHYGYALSEEEMQRKQQRNLTLLYRYVKNNPDKAYAYFQIGQSETILGNDRKAIEAYERSIALDENTEHAYVPLMIIALAHAYMRLERSEEALFLMDKYADSCKMAKYVATHASVLWDRGQHTKALILYVKATMLPDTDTLGEDLLRCYAHIIQGYLDMGDIKMADFFKEKFATCKAEYDEIV